WQHSPCQRKRERHEAGQPVGRVHRRRRSATDHIRSWCEPTPCGESYQERFGRGAAMKYDAWVAEAAKQPIVLETVDFGPLGVDAHSAGTRGLRAAGGRRGRGGGRPPWAVSVRSVPAARRRGYFDPPPCGAVVLTRVHGRREGPGARRPPLPRPPEPHRGEGN